ncbi:helix-turn-helix transcriptional regulator [Actinokineospora bangkokensis]|uniref:Transcriptional regulator n=1 Tax=Actinokineospora bangkokensis TaxID=1193682 RepID=A0A1Q9LK13_9PSEU|nr:helix-turn-helix transcriptional regulator [Actinokineospora bangkokensis]OLR92334.1 transcriptional regulator [Actinokineospora bangkokensis]
MSRDRAALGAFLRACRDRLTPAEAGITAFPGARRVPGLRKEEAALLAGLSTDHYSRLEQGRQHRVSDDVVNALARALRLSEVEHRHLRDLAAPTARARTGAWSTPQRPEPGLLRVLAGLDHLPALLLGRRGEVLARNALLVEVLGHDMAPGTSFPRYLFTDPGARERIVNWSDFAAAAVGGLRLELGTTPDDRLLTALVDELRAADPQVAAWWDEQGVADRASQVKHIAHPLAGALSFHIEAVSLPTAPHQRLVVYTTEPGSPTARLLPLLSSWGAPAPAP